MSCFSGLSRSSSMSIHCLYDMKIEQLAKLLKLPWYFYTRGLIRSSVLPCLSFPWLWRDTKANYKGKRLVGGLFTVSGWVPGHRGGEQGGTVAEFTSRSIGWRQGGGGGALRETGSRELLRPPNLQPHTSSQATLTSLSFPKQCHQRGTKHSNFCAFRSPSHSNHHAPHNSKHQWSR